MKKFLFSVSIALFVAFAMCSCKSNSVYTEQFPKYVPIDKLLSVQLGSTYDDVVKYLGCAPIDLVSRQKDGYEVFQYKYRIVYRDLEPRLFDQRGSETAGTESYYGGLKDAYLFFKGGKLMDIQTANGLRYSADWVMINNTLYNISKDGTGYNAQSMSQHKGDVPSEDSKPAGQSSEQGGKVKLPFFKSNK